MFPQVRLARNCVVSTSHWRSKKNSFFKNFVILISMEGAKTGDEAATIRLKSPIREVQWVAVNSIFDDYSESSFEDSVGTSSSSLDMVDDDASSSSSSFGPLYELSQLMAQLPIKSGLSKYYEGKSQSFGRLGNAMSLEDLPKEGSYSSHNKRMKSCKSLDGKIRSSFGPKATIKKKSYSRRPSVQILI